MVDPVLLQMSDPGTLPGRLGITVTEATPVNTATWGRLKQLFETP